MYKRQEKTYDKGAFPEFFDFCEGMPSNIELVYAQTCDEWSTSMLVNILKDKNNGKYYFQKSMLRYNSGRSLVEVSEPDQVEFASGYPINEETVFWMLRGQNTSYQASPHVFFNIGSKVYFYRYQTKQVYLFKDCSLSENPPSGKIVSMHTNPKTNEFGIAFSAVSYTHLDVYKRQTLEGGDTWSTGLQAEFNAYLNEECNIYCPIDWGDRCV